MKTVRMQLITIFFTCIIFIITQSSIAAEIQPITTPKKEPTVNSLQLKQIQKFVTAINEIKSFYVKPVTDEELFENAIRGMLSGLDPHSGYLDKSDFQDLTATTRGQFGGIGLEVTLDNGLLKVISPIDDTPAQKAGLKSGDIIIRLNETPTGGMSLPEAVSKMRGEKGTSLSLLVVRKGSVKPLTFKMQRDNIIVHSIKAKLLENGYGYVRLSHFQETTANDLVSNIDNLAKQSGGHLKGLVLDMRNNPGGLLDSAIAVSDVFLDSNFLGNNKEIVSTKGRFPGTDFVANATGKDILNGAPMVVLINEGSASGAEIVAGALQDHKRAILVGTTTFGKGSVQTILPLDKTTGIKLTTALYYTPSKRSIQAEGIVPDLKIEPMKFNKKQAQVLLQNIQNETLKERYLRGHLNNDGKQIKGLSNTAENSDLIFTDYTLYEGFNVLRSLVIMQEQAQAQAQAIAGTK